MCVDMIKFNAWYSPLKFEKSLIIYSKAVLYLFVTSQRQKTSFYDFFRNEAAGLL